jgi:hypothetical protein
VSSSESGTAISEDVPLDPFGNHFVEYTRTKAFAEEVLVANVPPRSDWVIVRPSLTLPDEAATQRLARETVWPLLVIKGTAAMPVNEAAQVDVVPLSFVTKAIVSIAQKTCRAHRIYHVTAGPDYSPTWSEFMDCLSATFRVPRTVCATGADWQRIRWTLAPAHIAAVRRVQCWFPFINQNVTFDNTRLKREFGLPDRAQFDFRRYLPALLRRVSVQEAVAQSAVDQRV